MHPVTGKRADDWSGENLSPWTRLALMWQQINGAAWLWLKEPGGTFSRVEMRNYAFVAYCMGDELVIDGHVVRYQP